MQRDRLDFSNSNGPLERSRHSIIGQGLALAHASIGSKKMHANSLRMVAPTPSPENASTSHRRALAPQSKPSGACHQTHEHVSHVTRCAQDCADRPCGSQRCYVSVCITGRKRTQEALSSPDAHRLSDGPTSPAQLSSGVLPPGRKSRRSFERNSKQEVPGWYQLRIGGVPPGWGPSGHVLLKGWGAPERRARGLVKRFRFR